MAVPRRGGSIAVAILLTTGVSGCGGAAVDPAAPDPLRRIESTPPSPRPSAKLPDLLLTFRLRPDGDSWYGTVYMGEQACGSFALERVRARTTGIVTHVAYDLSLTGANPDFWMAGETHGIIVRNRIVLDGWVHDGAFAGQPLHPRGRITYRFGPDSSPQPVFSGAVTLRPRPAPGERPTGYPPSPCAA